MAAGSTQAAEAAASAADPASNTVQASAQAGQLAASGVTDATGGAMNGTLSQTGDFASQAASLPEYSWSGYFMGLAMLCLMLAALWFVLRFLKKRGGLRVFGVGSGVQIENRVSLGPKKNLLVVRAHGKRLLIGVTDHHISRLADLPLEEDDENDDAIRRAGQSRQTGPLTAWKEALRSRSGGRKQASGRRKTSGASFSESLNQVIETVDEHDEQR